MRKAPSSSSLPDDSDLKRAVGRDLGSLAGHPPATLLFLCSLLFHGKRTTDARSAHVQCPNGICTGLYGGIVDASQLHLHVDRGRSNRGKVRERIGVCGRGGGRGQHRGREGLQVERVRGEDGASGEGVGVHVDDRN